MALFKRGWTDSDGRYPSSHKYLTTAYYPLCMATTGTWQWGERGASHKMKIKPPTNACGNCLRIDKARQSSRQRRGKKKKGA